MIEAKWADDRLSRNFSVFFRHLPDTPGIQLVGKLDREKSFESGARVVKAAPWLAELDLESLKPPYDQV
jgi:hypothetical protein